MSSYSHTVLMGRIATDVELRTTKGDVPVASIKLAVDRPLKSTDGASVADFHRVVFWGKLAEFVAKYFKKGSMILVSGQPQIRSYEDKDGNKRTITEFIARTAEFTCGHKEQDEGNDATPESPRGTTVTRPTAEPAANDDESYETPDDDLPF